MVGKILKILFNSQLRFAFDKRQSLHLLPVLQMKREVITSLYLFLFFCATFSAQHASNDFLQCSLRGVQDETERGVAEKKTRKTSANVFRQRHSVMDLREALLMVNFKLRNVGNVYRHFTSMRNALFFLRCKQNSKTRFLTKPNRTIMFGLPCNICDHRSV